MSSPVRIKQNMKQKHLLIFIPGFIVGVLVCILIAYVWGPRAETLELDLYSGQQRTIKEFLWHYRISPKAADEHTLWAKKHQQRSITPWYVMVSSTQRPSWFGPVVSGDAYIRDVVRSIHDLSIPDGEKAKLLYEYWSSLDKARSEKPIESVFEQWDKVLRPTDIETSVARIREGANSVVTMDNFLRIKEFVLAGGQRRTYCNMYNNNPFYGFEGLTVFLHPDGGQENINCDLNLSDFNHIVFNTSNPGYSYWHVYIDPDDRDVLVLSKAYLEVSEPELISKVEDCFRVALREMGKQR